MYAQHFCGSLRAKIWHTCRKQWSNFTCIRPAEARALTLMCARQVLTQTRQKRRLDSMRSISRTEAMCRACFLRLWQLMHTCSGGWQSCWTKREPKKKKPFILTCTSRRQKLAHAAGTYFHARNDGPFSHVHASPAGNRTDHMRATHAPR